MIRKRPLGIVGCLLTAGALLLGCPQSASAQADDPCVVTGAETVRLDRPHYLPFETVSISGRGYGPSCDFTVEVAGAAGSSNVLVTTDSSGNLAATYDLGAATGDYAVSVVAPGGAAAARAAFTSGTYVMADRAEYAPHDPVTISGRGWQPGETVSLLLQEQPATHPERTLTATADASGTFVNTSFSPEQHDAGVAFTLTATGSVSTSRTAFGDSAVAFDFASSGTSTGNVATTVTFPHTIGNGNNRLLVVAISTRPNAPSLVKYGGVPMLSAGTFTNPSVSPQMRVQFFYLTNPPTGTANVTYNITAGSVAGSTSFSGVYQPVPFGSSAGTFGTSLGCVSGVVTVCGNPQPSITVLNGDNDLILDALSISVGTGNSSVAAGAGQTKQWDIRQGGPTVKMRGTGSTKAATGGVTNMSWTLSAAGGDGNPSWVIGALPIQAVMPPDHFIVTTSVATTSAGSGFNVTVTAQDQFFNTATAYDGTVHFTSTDGQAILPADYTFVPGDNGVHTFTGVILGTVGSQTITATDAGDGLINGTSPNVTVTTGPLHHLVLTPTPATITFGGSQAYTAEGFDQFNNSRGDVTGSTTFSISPDGSCAAAACTPGSAGAHLVTGDDGGKIGTANLQVDKANQTITFGGLAGKTFGDADFSVGAAATSGLAVSFTASGNCTVAGAVVHITAAGSCTITAQQAGDANYFAAPDLPQTFSIAKAGQTISFAALAGKTFGDPDFGVSATASSGLAVSFAASGDCTVALAAVHLTAAGSCTITAQQPGDGNYDPAADVPRTFSIAQASQTISFGPLGGKTFGDLDFSVSATASSGLAVTFTASGNCTVLGTLVHIAGAGGCTVTAHQGGGGNYTAAADVPRSFSIAPASQTIVFGALAGKTFGDPAFSVSAAASSGLPVSFTASGNCTVIGALVQLTSAGSCTVVAHQGGDANFSPALDVSQSFPIATGDSLGPITSGALASPNPAPAGAASIALTANVSDAATGGSNVASARYRVDGGSYVPMSAADSAFDSPTEAVAATLPGFAAAGIHNVCVSGADSAGNTGAEECFLLAVYDPTGGLVTGGGWINSPAGAFTASPTMTGKANFGFNSKYSSGEMPPTGDTQFQLQAVNFKFKSASCEWLIISGNKAQYLGSGTVNGSGKYGFMVTVLDGKLPGGDRTDRFRIKIYDQNQGNAVVYDNQPGAPDTANPASALGGGSIVIH